MDETTREISRPVEAELASTERTLAVYIRRFLVEPYRVVRY